MTHTVRQWACLAEGAGTVRDARAARQVVRARCARMRGRCERNCATKKRANDPVFTPTGQASPPTLKHSSDVPLKARMALTTLRPELDLPRVTRARGPLRPRAANELDALFVVVPESVAPRAFASLPEAQRWRELHAREKARTGSVRSTSLANSRQSLAVLGYLRPEASPFERLALAGRMLKEAGSRGVASIALAALGDRSTNTASLEALLAAAFAHAFALPSFRSARPERRRLREITLIER